MAAGCAIATGTTIVLVDSRTVVGAAIVVVGVVVGVVVAIEDTVVGDCVVAGAVDVATAGAVVSRTTAVCVVQPASSRATSVTLRRRGFTAVSLPAGRRNRKLR